MSSQMTYSQKRNIKNNIHVSIIITNFVLLLGVFYKIGVIQTTIEKDVDYHIKDVNLHMPLKEKILYFVPRDEFEEKIENIKKERYVQD